MITSVIKHFLNKHVSNYVQSLFAERLVQEGFVNYKNRDISWFRTRNDEIINSIIFNTSWNKIPILLDVCCGVYPLFSDVYLTCQAFDDNLNGFDYERFKREYIHNLDASLRVFSDDAKVFCNEHMGYGVHTLDNIILPRMNSINSVSDCYQFHKQWRIEVAANEPEYMYCSLSPTFIDEAIYLDDQEMYSDCLKRVDNCIEIYSNLLIKSPKNEEYARSLEKYRMQKHALLDGARNEYLEILEQRKQKNIAMLDQLNGGK